MKPARFSNRAQREINHGVAFYNDARAGLGDDFRDAVESAIEMIEKQPKAFPPYRLGYRKFLLKRFPYSIFYYEYDDYVWVATVHHASREPDTWMESTHNGAPH